MLQNETHNIEIERKFLVKSDIYKQLAYNHTDISQGYLCADSERTVRIRKRGAKAYITIKGKADDEGWARFEWEKEIAPEDASELLLLCGNRLIEKTRYEVQHGTQVIEVDEFKGAHAGLVIAEVELRTKTEAFEAPDWLGDEVTGDVRYYNAWLSKNQMGN